jgi:hypothetical protein
MPKVATKRVAKKATSAEAEPLAGLDEFAQSEDGGETESWFATMDDDDDSIDFANVLYWGKEGSTKTTNIAKLANIAPDGSKVLVLNAEGGLKKIALRRQGVDTSKLVFWPNPKLNQKLTHRSLERVYERVKADLMDNPKSWFAVSWDSITEIYQEILDQSTESRQANLRKQGKDFDPDFVDRSDYGTMSKKVRKLLRDFRDLPCHYFVSALERRDMDPDTGKPVYGPAVSPALSTDLLGYVDIAIYMKAPDEEGPARGMTQRSARYRVKDRFGVLPRVMAVPSGDRIISYLSGELTEETDPFQDDLPDKAKKSLDRPDQPLSEVDDADDEEDGEAEEHN